jgi:hypothetical protein
MTTKPTPLRPQSQHPYNVARVVKTSHGEATHVDLWGTIHAIAGHLHHVDLLHPEDRVLITETDMGWIVCGRLRTTGATPQPRLEQNNGRLMLEADQVLCLQAGNNRLEIRADGCICLDGDQITSIARGRMRLQGATIELN